MVSCKALSPALAFLSSSSWYPLQITWGTSFMRFVLEHEEAFLVDGDGNVGGEHVEAAYVPS